MTKGLTFFLLTLLLVVCAVPSLAQDKSAITVKASEVNNGVVIVDISKAGKGYELQCNHGMPNCTPLKSGKYQMIELPSNSGMYDCKDVEIYPEPTGNPEADKKIGEYCLTAK